MSSFCSISLTLWSPSSLFHIQKWSQNCLFHKPVPLSNKALPPRKCCPHLSIKFLYSVLSICRVLVLPEDITSHRTDQEGSWVSKATLLSLSLSFTVYSVISSTHYWTSRLDPDITFSLRPPEQITRWAGTWSPPFLGSLNIYWAIVLASRLPFFFFFFWPVPFPFLLCSPILSLTFPCPMMIQWWLLTDERHTHEKEYIFMGRIFQNWRGIAPGGSKVGDIQILE